MADLTGHTLGRYRILEQLGEGGMATVYKAYDTRLEREVAVKTIRVDQFPPAMLEQILKRFEREAKALARLTHPNIVHINDFGEHEGVPYLVMDYLPGGTFKDRMRLPVSWQTATRLLLPVASALEYAHKHKIIHRDVKPANILLTDNGQPMLTDFGIAKILETEVGQTLTGTGLGIGTPEYMAPEQGMGRQVDGRADIYSLGIVFYELITARKPYSADTPMAVVFKHISDPLPDPRQFVPDLPENVARVLFKALAKAPEDRYPDVESFSEALEKLIRTSDGSSSQTVDLPVDGSKTIDLKLVDTPTVNTPLPFQTVITERAPEHNPSKPSVPVDEVVSSMDQPVGLSARKNLSGLQLGFGLGGIVLVIGLIIWLASGGAANLFPASTVSLPATATLAQIVVPGALPSEPATATFTQIAVPGALPSVLPTGMVTTPASLPIEVTIWHTYGTGSAEETAMTKLAAQAAIDLPQYKINVLQIPFADIFNKYRTDVAAGGGPDMFIAPNDSLGDDARAGLIADITDLAKSKLTGVNQLGIDGMSLDGKLYGIPESMKALALWYDKSKLPVPPKTTAELQKLMEGGTPISISYGCYHQYGFYSAFGGNIFDASWKVVADQGSGVIDAMTYLNGLYQISKKNGWPKTDSDGLAPFSEGKVVAITNGNWAMGDYQKALGANLAVAPLPAGPAGPAKPMLGIDGYYINPNSANKAAAVDVALYLTNAASQTVMMGVGHVPVRTDVRITDPLIQGLVDAFNTGATIRPQVAQLGKYWSNFCGTDQVYEKGVAPEQWIKDATAASNK